MHRFISLLLFCLSLATAHAQLSRDIRENIIASVVQIVPFDNEVGLFEAWSGSGSVISPDGYILSNFHVIGDDITGRYYDHLAVYTLDVENADKPPVFTHWARFVAGIPEDDLALLKIYARADDAPLETSFHAVPVGNSDELLPGDGLTIVGYPGISGSTITFTSGLMSGWLGEDLESGGRRWIKTDGKISYGNSGGATFNERGELIGIPTAIRNVRYDEDDVQEQAYLRPINLAWYLVGNYAEDAWLASPSLAAKLKAASLGDSHLLAGATDLSPRRAEEAAYASGEYGDLAINEAVESVIDFSVDNSVYHTYSLSIPEGIKVLTIALDGKGRDVDMAVNADEEIVSYQEGEVDFIDTTNSLNPHYTLYEPKAGTFYIDVINFLDAPIAYRLEVKEGLYQTAQDSTEVQGSGEYGALALGGAVAGVIAAKGDASFIYHTYTVDVPPGLDYLDILLDGMGGDIDLALKADSPIETYDEVDYLDSSETTTASYRYEALALR
ncbi:MAG: serine protease [Deinococcales bacterium]